jgi:hypothetical protein
VLKKDPNAWWAYVARATAKRYQDRKAEALQDFEAALDAAGKINDDVAANDVVRAMGDVIGPDEAISRIQGRVEPKWKIMTRASAADQGRHDGGGAVAGVGDRAGGRAVGRGQDQRLPLRRHAVPVGRQPRRSRRSAYEKLLQLAPTT